MGSRKGVAEQSWPRRSHCLKSVWLGEEDGGGGGSLCFAPGEAVQMNAGAQYMMGTVYCMGGKWEDKKRVVAGHLTGWGRCCYCEGSFPVLVIVNMVIKVSWSLGAHHFFYSCRLLLIPSPRGISMIDGLNREVEGQSRQRKRRVTLWAAG